jgi:hypothetical protein
MDAETSRHFCAAVNANDGVHYMDHFSAAFDRLGVPTWSWLDWQVGS